MKKISQSNRRLEIDQNQINQGQTNNNQQQLNQNNGNNPNLSSMPNMH